MPWRESSPMNEKTQFIGDYLRGTFNVTELCDAYGISRKTAYKWIDRYVTQGPAGLEDRERSPWRCPHKTPADMEQTICEVRRRHPSWGGRKIRRRLIDKEPKVPWPASSTINDILKRNGFIRETRRRNRVGHPGKPQPHMDAPNDTWTADFKGHFKTRNGVYCYPLTVADGHSHFLLGCQALLSTDIARSKPVFTRLFKDYGLPVRIRTDNGAPFAAHALGRLSKLSAWWIRVGIYPEFIEPGKPQQNGRHERMHKTLKAETTRPPAANYKAQQRKFNAFRNEFNTIRPHEALDMDTPAVVYHPSTRPMPNKLIPLEYPDRFIKRLVSTNGGIRWKSWHVPVSTACAGEYVGLEDIDEGLYNVYFGPLKLGRLWEKKDEDRGCLWQIEATQTLANSVTYVPGHFCYLSTGPFRRLTEPSTCSLLIPTLVKLHFVRKFTWHVPAIYKISQQMP